MPHKPVTPDKQRRAAALLLCAIELPAEVGAVTKVILQACKICPGLTTADMPSLQGRQGRIDALTAVYNMVGELIQEAKQ